MGKILSLVMFLVLLLATPQYGWAQQKKKCNDYQRLMNGAKAYIAKEDYRQALEKLNAAKACDPLQAATCNEMILSVFDKIEKQRKDAVDAKDQALKARAQANKARTQAKIAEKKATNEGLRALDEKKDADIQRLIAIEQKAIAEAQTRIADSLKIIAQQQTIIANIESEKAKASALATKALQILNQNNTLALRLAEKADEIASTEDTQEALMDITNNIRNLFYNAVLEGHLGGIYAVAADHTGEFILTGSSDFSAKLWKKDGTFIRTFIGHKGTVNAVAFSPKGDYILTGSADNTVKQWTKDGVLMNSFEGQSAVTSLAISEDNNTFVIGYADNSAGLRRLSDNVESLFKPKWVDDNEVQKRVFSIKSVAFVGDSILTASTDYSVQIWNKEGNLLGKLQQESPITAMAALGSFVLTGSTDKVVRLWQINNGKTDKENKPIKTFVGHQSTVTSVALGYENNSNELVIASGSSDNSSILWTKNGRIDRIMQGHTLAVNAVCISKNFIITGSADRSAKIWQIASSQSKYLDTFKSIQTMAITPDGRSLLVGGKSKILKMISLQDTVLTKSKYFSLGQSLDVMASAFTQNGETFLLAETGNVARLHNAQTGEVLTTYKGHKSIVTSVAFSPDDKKVLTGSWDRTAILWDIDGRALITFKGHTGFIYSVCFLPNGKSVLTSSADNTIRLWDIETGQTIRTFIGHTGQVYAIAVSKDGKQLVSGSEDKTIRLWDIEQGTNIKTFAGHSARINAVAFSNDGKTFVSGSADKSIRVWSEKEGYISVLTGHKDVINTLNFTSDGKFIISGSADSTIRKWDWAPIGKLTNLQKIQYKFDLAPAALFETQQTDLLENYAQTLIKQLDKKATLDTIQLALICRIFDNVRKSILTKDLAFSHFKTRIDVLQQALTKPELKDILKPFGKGLAGYDSFSYAAMPAAHTDMNKPEAIDKLIKKRISRVVNVFETGSADAMYDNVTIYADGKEGARQISYGRTFATEQGNLKDLINSYVDRNGILANEFRPYLSKIGIVSLSEDRAFLELLKQAALDDPIMIATQDDLYDKRYFQPAYNFFKENGFTYPLSMLVILDSYNQSGKITDNLRRKVTIELPVNSGNEKEWIKAYVKVRSEWLLTKNEIVAKTAYRTAFMLKEIENDNWQLNKLPLVANGVTIKE